MSIKSMIRNFSRNYILIDVSTSSRYYLDVCHLTIDGATRWVEHVLRALGHTTPEVVRNVIVG